MSYSPPAAKRAPRTLANAVFSSRAAAACSCASSSCALLRSRRMVARVPRIDAASTAAARAAGMGIHITSAASFGTGCTLAAGLSAQVLQATGRQGVQGAAHCNRLAQHLSLPPVLHGIQTQLTCRNYLPEQQVQAQPSCGVGVFARRDGGRQGQCVQWRAHRWPRRHCLLCVRQHRHVCRMLRLVQGNRQVACTVQSCLQLLPGQLQVRGDGSQLLLQLLLALTQLGSHLQSAARVVNRRSSGCGKMHARSTAAGLRTCTGTCQASLLQVPPGWETSIIAGAAGVAVGLRRKARPAHSSAAITPAARPRTAPGERRKRFTAAASRFCCHAWNSGETSSLFSSNLRHRAAQGRDSIARLAGLFMHPSSPCQACTPPAKAPLGLCGITGPWVLRALRSPPWGRPPAYPPCGAVPAPFEELTRLQARGPLGLHHRPLPTDCSPASA